MATRGIVLHSQATIHSSGRPVDGRPSPEELRRYALYWDMLDWPVVNGLKIDPNARDDIELLREEGILMETEIGYTDHIFPPDIVLDPQEHNMQQHFGLGLKAGHDELVRMEREVQSVIANNHNQHTPDQMWSVGETRLQPKDQPFNQESVKTIELRLLNTIISPAADVPMADVLEFKLKHRSELLAFRNAMDSIYLDVAESEEFDRAYVQAKEELVQAVLDLNQLMNESKMNRVASSLKVKLNSLAVQTILSGVAFGSAANTVELPTLASALTGVAMPSLVTGVVEALMPPEIPEALTDYSYLYSIDNQLIGD